MSVTIAGQTYATATSLERAARSRLPKNAGGTARPLPVDDFWQELLAHHRDLASKASMIPGGAVAIGYRADRSRPSTIHFGLMGARAEFVAFGWRTACRDAFGLVRPDRMAIVREGFREAIKPQMAAFRDSRRLGHYYLTDGGQLFPGHEVHVDHDPIDFITIVNAFLAALSPEERDGPLTLTHHADPHHGRYEDRIIDEGFQRWHESIAAYRMISVADNLSKPKARPTIPLEILATVRAIAGL